MPRILEDCTDEFKSLLTSSWERDITIVYGKEYVNKRCSATYKLADGGNSMSYSGKVVETQDPPEAILSIWKKLIDVVPEAKCSNMVHVNLYEDGEAKLGLHSDNPKENDKDSYIISVSLGATRKFRIRENGVKGFIDLPLSHGDVVLMDMEMQRYWKHEIPVEKKVKDPRINLTFRYKSA